MTPAMKSGVRGICGDGREIEHLSHLGHIGGKDLVAELEGEILPRLRDFVNAHDCNSFLVWRVKSGSRPVRMLEAPPCAGQ